MFNWGSVGVFCLALTLSACGLYTPEMSYPSALVIPPGSGVSEADFESNIIAHVACEISVGLIKAHDVDPSGKTLGWLTNAGAFVTFKLVAEDQGSLGPGATLLKTLPLAQTFSLGFGASGSANATRTETIQLTFPDKQLFAIAKQNAKTGHRDCKDLQKGVMIDSDLKISDFIYDKALVSSRFYPNQKISPFTQLQFDLNFLASYGANVTPTWKFTKVLVDPNGTLASSTRTNTNDVTITIGALKDSNTQALHTASLTGSLTGQAVQSASH